ncbi:MAG: hypothetical protein ABW051_07315 [Burkholderiaceae bacterium]
MAMQPNKAPPKFVPTLTEVVQGRPAMAQGAQEEGPLSHDPALMEDQIVHRVMQRLDMTLERKLREAVATLVLEQTQSLAPLLREEIELAVRQSVSEAVAQELLAASNRR